MTSQPVIALPSVTDLGARGNLLDVYAEVRAPLLHLADYAISELALYLGDGDVPDPMGQGDDAFHECALLIEAGTALHLGRHA